MAPTWHQWGGVPHTCINKRKMCKQTWSPFIVFSFSTTFPPKFHSWGRCTMALTNMYSDLRSNPSSGLCIYIIYNIYWMFNFASWGAITRVLQFGSWGAKMKAKWQKISYRVIVNPKANTCLRNISAWSICVAFTVSGLVTTISHDRLSIWHMARGRWANSSVHFWTRIIFPTTTRQT